jgi:hypothetical protein
MAYIFGIVIVALFFMLLHYFTELNAKQKTGITLMALAIVGSAWGFNAYNDSQREKVAQIERKYNQGKKVECNGVEVTKEGFSYSVGTQTFIGREGTEHYTRMISAYECQ